MNVVDIILKKRDGKELSADEIGYFVREYTAGAIPDYQASALLMAIYLKGMTKAETVSLTLAMRDSGGRADLSAIEGFKIDKHSTGGVGDKTTLVAAPIAAACGLKVAKMSGRGLSFTGGTIDKLQAIPGFRTSLSGEEFTAAVNSVGLSVIEQSCTLAPADRKLYALRDVTGTVESLPLIASSIMSKKLATGADGLVLDVKVGSGAFCKTASQARALAETMVGIGQSAGIVTKALPTDMETPLGRTIGNALEVAEAVETLRGRGERHFTALCIELSALMLECADLGDEARCRALAEAALKSGEALRRFRGMVAAQGGDLRAVDDTSLLPRAAVTDCVKARETGCITRQDAELLGRAALALGAGRLRKEDDVDPSAGIVLEKKRGDRVEAGETVATLHTNRPETLKEAKALAEAALAISDMPAPPHSSFPKPL